jgi:hypothetical protein
MVWYLGMTSLLSVPNIPQCLEEVRGTMSGVVNASNGDREEGSMMVLESWEEGSVLVQESQEEGSVS